MIACSALLFPAGKVFYIPVKQELNKENKSIRWGMGGGGVGRFYIQKA